MDNFIDLKDFEKEITQKKPSLELALQSMDMKLDILKKIRIFLKENAMTQEVFAEKLGVSQQTVSRFLKGNINPRFDFILKVFTVINANVDIPKLKNTFRVQTIQTVHLKRDKQEKMSVTYQFQVN